MINDKFPVTEEDMVAWISDEDAARYRKLVRRLSKPPMKKRFLLWLNNLGRSPQKDKN